MTTKEQIDRLCKGKSCCTVLAVLTRDYKPPRLNYSLLKGTVVEIDVYSTCTAGVLYVNDKFVDLAFPYDAAELLNDQED